MIRLPTLNENKKQPIPKREQQDEAKIHHSHARPAFSTRVRFPTNHFPPLSKTSPTNLNHPFFPAPPAPTNTAASSLLDPSTSPACIAAAAASCP